MNIHEWIVLAYAGLSEDGNQSSISFEAVTR